MADRPRRRFAVRWLALGVVTTVAALWLTIPAISVDLSNNPMILATAFTPSRDANASFGFHETNAGTDVTIDFQLDGNQPPAERLVLLSFAASCSAPANGATLPLAVTASQVRPAFDTQNFPNAYRIVIPASVPADAEVLCHLAVKPLRATYSERRIAFARDISLPSSEIGAGWQQTRADIYVFQQKNAENLKVDHADPTGGSLHQDNAYQRGMGSDFNPVTMDWTDVPAERLHEFIYFIGAALIGLALSCYIEVARPWLSDGT